MYCNALPIVSYGGRGVAKPGVNKSEHAIVYMGKTVPQPNVNEQPQRPGEAAMRTYAIQVDPDYRENLDRMSRIDFGGVHKVQHNVKVKSFGVMNADSISALMQQFENVWQLKPISGLSRASNTAQTMEIDLVLPLGPPGLSISFRTSKSQQLLLLEPLPTTTVRNPSIAISMAKKRKGGKIEGKKRGKKMKGKKKGQKTRAISAALPWPHACVYSSMTLIRILDV